MPMRAPKVRSCGCVVSGRCACQRARDRQRPTATAQGYGAEWRALRASMPRTPCAACGAEWRAGFHLDHRLARSRGGNDHPSNLQWMCRQCHSRKTVKSDGGLGQGHVGNFSEGCGKRARLDFVARHIVIPRVG
jgi:5-methylcytosine-specific restriction endonuclease McrA